MPFGTASARLRKAIMFHLLQRLGENVCIQCAKLIDKSAELSIEHKQPWLDVDADLFWDMENISFSHLRCNTSHRRRSGGVDQRKIGPEGTAWCWQHKAFLPVENFASHRSRWNRLAGDCRDCHRAFENGRHARRRQSTQPNTPR